MNKVLFNRREFLRFFASGTAGVGLLAGGFGVDRIVPPVWDQYQTWQATDCDAATFLKKYGPQLAHIHFGANICPDYKLMAAKADPTRAVKILKEYFGCAHVRLGMWWSTHIEQGLDAYDHWIEALLKQELKVVLGYGLKAPFPPETHFPKAIQVKLLALGAIPGSTVSANSPLGRMALDYTQALLEHLDRAFGLDSFYGFNPENEFDAPYGQYALASGEDLLRLQAQLLYTPNHRRRLLLNTAIISLPGYPASLTTTIKNALALRQEFPTLDPIVGVDIYEETGSGRISPNLYVDTFAGVRMRHGNSLIPDARRMLAENHIPLEVAEFQISDWINEPRGYQPGSRVHTQYLLARMIKYLIDDPPMPLQEPMLVRLWEMSNFLLNMLHDEQFFQTNDDYALIQQINRGL
jgi:hypothetical protein